MSTFTLTVASAGGTEWGDIALVFRNSAGPGNSASGTGSGSPSLNITTRGDHSAICAIVLDARAVSGASRAWLAVNGTAPSAANGFELGYTLVSGTYGIYIAYWPDAGLAGTKTVGLSAPAGMTWTAVATEILGSTTAPSNTAALPAGFSVAANPPWTNAHAALPVSVSMSATGLGFKIESATLPAGFSLTGGAAVGVSAALPVVTGMTAAVTGWIFTSLIPLTYLQYLGTGGTLEAEPGQFRTDITPASGYPWQLDVPPPDGRWVSPFPGPSPVPPVKLAARAPAPLRTALKAHGQPSRSAYQKAGSRRRVTAGR